MSLRINNITKTFGDVIANYMVNFELQDGEIHALLGENGAGKSTLMNIISGIYQADSGKILINENEVTINNSKDSIDLGISMIHQHFTLIDKMTVLENLMLGQVGEIFVSKEKYRKKFKEIIDKYSLEIDLNKYIYELSMGEKQIVEIIKVLSRNPQTMIFDEPTTVLTPQEVSKLFVIMRRLRDLGFSIIFISHKLDEVTEICDKVTILRKGSTVKTVNVAETSSKELIDLMVGKKTDLKIERTERIYGNDVLLSVKNITVKDPVENLNKISDFSFKVYKGEILGVAGISGHGQKELCESLTGIIPVQEGSITIDNEEITNLSVKKILKSGIQMSFVPEDRLGMGLVGNMDIVDNLMLREYYNQGIFLKKKGATDKANKIVNDLAVVTSGINDPIKNMSGGNIQKVLLGRELELRPKVLITAYPVRGLDINTTHKIYDLLNEQKASGVGVVYVAEDLDSLIALSDRVMVMHQGKNMGIFDAATITKEDIGVMMVGGRYEKN